MKKIIYSSFTSILFISQSQAGSPTDWCEDVTPYKEACYSCRAAPASFPSCKMVACTYDDGYIIKDLPLSDCRT